MTKMHDGLAARCKKCQSQNSKERNKNPVQKKKNIELTMNWYRANKEVAILRMRKWRNENKKN